MENMICPICNKNNAIWNKKEQWWDICTSCQEEKLETLIITEKIKAGIPKLYQKFTLNYFNDSSVNKLRANSDNFHKNIIIEGISFTGKTTLACAIIDDVLRRTIPKGIHLFLSFVNVFELMTKVVYNKDIFWKELDKIKNCDILLLDEMVSEFSDEEYRFLYLLLNHRNAENKTTITTTNCEIRDSRLFSRLMKADGVRIEITKDTWKRNAV